MLPYIERVVKKYKKTLNVSKLYTTAEAARLAGITRQTLQVWIVSGKIKPPEVQRPSRLRLWTSQDVAPPAPSSSLGFLPGLRRNRLRFTCLSWATSWLVHKRSRDGRCTSGGLIFPDTIHTCSVCREMPANRAASAVV